MSNQQIAVVSGSNRGIGKEIVKQLHAQGFKVIATARKLSDIKEFAKELGSEIIPVEVDVSSDKSCDLFSLFLKENYKKIDVLINNAGIMGESTISAFNMLQIEKVMNTNVYGAIRLTKAVFPFLKNSTDGRIINISSGMGELNSLHGSSAAYRLSKLALNGFTIMLADDLKDSNIKVNAVCPGWCQTEMGGSGATRTAAKGAETAVWLATEKRIPTGKFLRDNKVIEW
jgi:NAD(P)-dependent dehydrogenase (short-subunit alcohol dehydrogenase family)